MEGNYTLDQIEDAVDQYVQTWTRDQLELFVYEHLLDKFVKADDDEVHEFMMNPNTTREEHPHG